jgi:hypothetical protein
MLPDGEAEATAAGLSLGPEGWRRRSGGVAGSTPDLAKEKAAGVLSGAGRFTSH